MEKRPRAVFWGTPRFSVPCLVGLTGIADVTLAVSQPDREAGRQRRVCATPVKECASCMRIPVAQPDRLRDEWFLSILRAEEADFFFVLAYGKILPEEVLSIPRLGCLNLHASLLPRYRGSAPIQWAVINGERTTGLTLMRMDRGMDTGPIIAAQELPVGPEETAEELAGRMCEAAPLFIAGQLPRYLRGEATPALQDDARATLAPMLKKKDGLIDWTLPARDIARRVRGLTPWPMACTFSCGRRVIVARAREAVEDAPAALAPQAPGSVATEGGRIFVRCGEGAVELLRLQPEGKKEMDAASFLRGACLPPRFDPAGYRRR